LKSLNSSKIYSGINEQVIVVKYFLHEDYFQHFFYLFVTGRGSMILLQMLSTKNRGDVGKGLSKIAKTIYIQKLKKDVCKEQHFSIL